ncbi:MAG: LON peptidase substrate-binding domain-containing protein [Planctomycetaceae bacterium]
MDLPMFPLHTVLFPGQRLDLRVFEERYRSLLDDVLPHGPFAIAAIRHGAEVGGPADPYRVGVAVEIEVAEVEDDDAWRLAVRATERIALLVPREGRPYPRWDTAVYPDEGGAGTDDVEAALVALGRYLAATGERGAHPVVPHRPVEASWARAAAAPGLLPARQALLEVPGAGERLHRVRDLFDEETRLVRALGAGLGGADPVVSPN